jgi:pimeloyl-ACP methyl ester carboxylesterase
MVRLQDEGVYPAAFRSITAPTIMLHGRDDPHPGRMVHESLRPFVRRLEYVEWDRCGHYPWLERDACKEFYRVLRRWLKRH